MKADDVAQVTSAVLAALRENGGGGNGNPGGWNGGGGRFSRAPERTAAPQAIDGDVSVPCKFDLGDGRTVRYYVPVGGDAFKSDDDFRAALDRLEAAGHVVDVYERKPDRGGNGGGDRGGRFSGGRGGDGGGRGDGRKFYARCSDCGREAELSFEPRGNEPVYCSGCFRDHRRGGRR